MPLPIIPVVLLTVLSSTATTGTVYIGAKSVKAPSSSSTYNQPLGKNVTPPRFGPKVPKKPLGRTGTKSITR